MNEFSTPDPRNRQHELLDLQLQIDELRLSREAAMLFDDTPERTMFVRDIDWTIAACYRKMHQIGGRP